MHVIRNGERNKEMKMERKMTIERLIKLLQT